MQRASTLVAVVLAAAALVAFALLLLQSGTDFDTAGFAIAGVAYVVTGVLVSWRRPDNRVGWLLAPTGTLMITGSLAEAHLATAIAGQADGWVVLAAWWGSWYWIPYLFTQFVFLPLLFPTGSVLNRRWGKVLVAAAAVTVAGVVITMLAADLTVVGSDGSVRMVLSNPIGLLPFSSDEVVAPTLSLLALPFVLGALVSLPLRFRRAGAVARHQILWVVTGLGLVVMYLLLVALFDLVFDIGDLGNARPPVIDQLVPAIPPVSIAIAVMRFRLWDIDRLLSRTVTYAIVTAVIAATYAGVVVIAQSVTGLDESSDVVVAGATLAAAALFRPARHRVQATVDRRFNRAQYDASRVVAEFGQRLRDDVDQVRVSSEIRQATSRALHPAHVSVWLRPTDRVPAPPSYHSSMMQGTASAP